MTNPLRSLLFSPLILTAALHTVSGQTCCSRDFRPVCLIGVSACCPDSDIWACRDDHNQDYQCPGGGRIDGKKHKICGETGFTYQEPLWWELVNTQFTNVARCRQRDFAPKSGDRCGKTPKKCFWGTRKEGCLINGSVSAAGYPQVMCECQGASPGAYGTWECNALDCESPPPDFP